MKRQECFNLIHRENVFNIDTTFGIQSLTVCLPSSFQILICTDKVLLNEYLTTKKPKAADPQNHQPSLQWFAA